MYGFSVKYLYLSLKDVHLSLRFIVYILVDSMTVVASGWISHTDTRDRGLLANINFEDSRMDKGYEDSK